MKKDLWLMMIVSCAVFAMSGCASTAVTGVPEGSVLVAIYEGTFSGTGNEGSIEVKLYRAPDGSQPCYGNFGEEGSYLNFRGGLKGDELQGEILLPMEGTISGKLVSGGEALSGTYKFTVPPFDHGTWQAQKKSSE